jgi:hypothetical protein
LRQKGSQSALVVGLTGVFGLQEIKQIVRSWQAADMRCLNVVGILLQGHRVHSELRIEKILSFSKRRFIG